MTTNEGTRSFLAVAVLFAAIGCAAQDVSDPAIQAAPRLWKSLQPGNVANVGFTRIARGADTISVWYPSGKGDRRLSLADYAANRLEDFEAPFVAQGISQQHMDTVVAEPLYALLDAPARDDSFPLILIAHGNGQDVVDQAILAEYIASHGYVVASTPSPMLSRPMRSMSEMAEFAEAQADGLARADSTARSRFRIQGPSAIVAHSFGARAALLFVMRNDTPSAIVSLDGGIGTATGSDELRNAPSFDTARPPGAVLHVYERLDSFMTPDFDLLTGLDVPLLDLRPATLHHIHFTTLGFLAVADSAIARLTRATPTTASALEDVARSTVQFLERVRE